MNYRHIGLTERRYWRHGAPAYFTFIRTGRGVEHQGYRGSFSLQPNEHRSSHRNHGEDKDLLRTKSGRDVFLRLDKNIVSDALENVLNYIKLYCWCGL